MSNDPYKEALPARVRKPGDQHQYISSFDGGVKPRNPPQNLNNIPSDLTSQLATKLRTVQEENENIKLLLRRANEENKLLNEEIQILEVRAPNNFDEQDHKNTQSDLTKEQKEYIKILEKEVFGMEKYLERNNLLYLEDEEEDKVNKNDQYTQHELKEAQEEIVEQIDELKSESYKPPAKEELEEKIRKLNLLAGSRMELNKNKDNMHKFQDRESIMIRFYENGVYIGHGPFRPYSEKSIQALVDDIMTGYLPSEWEEEFPNGVEIDAYFENEPFEVCQPEEFQGRGHQLGDEIPEVPYPDDVVKQQTERDRQEIRGNIQYSQYGSKQQQMVNELDKRYLEEKPQSVEEFLNKIPEFKFIGSKVINVREQVAKDLGLKNSPNMKMEDLGRTIVIQNNENQDEVQNDEYITTIRVKVNSPEAPQENGRNIVLKISYTTSLHSVYEEIAEALKCATGEITLIKMLGEELQSSDRTVEEAGLCPNARLNCKVVGSI